MSSLIKFLKGLFIKRKIYPNLCLDCEVRGQCCHYAFIFGGYNLLTRHTCKYLNEETGLCRIYPMRFKINPNCTDMKDAYKYGNLPEKCEYLKIRPLKKGVKPKIDYFPDDLSKKDRFNWEVFNKSHRDFVEHYFNEKETWYDYFVRLDKLIDKLRNLSKNLN